MDENPEDGPESLSAEEFMQEFSKLEELQKYWLLSKAKTLAFETVYSGSGEALLHEALCRILAKRRHPKSGLKVTTYIFGVMRSIISDERRKHPQGVDFDSVGDQETSSDSDHSLPGEKQLEITGIKRAIESEFGESSVEITILNLYLDEWSQKDICELEDLTRLEYEAAMRRVRRFLLNKHSGDTP